MTHLRVIRSENRAKRAHISRSIFTTDSQADADRVAAGMALMPLLDLLLVSIVVTDQEARILYANRRGSALLAEGRALRNGSGKLSAANPKCALELRRAILKAATGGRAASDGCGEPVPLPAENRELTAWVLPLERVTGVGHGQAAIFVQEKRAIFSSALFMRRFGATPAELRILELLLDGMTTAEIAPTLKISFNTVRTHLKSLFAKTGTCRQTELLRLATCAVAPACFDDRPRQGRLPL